MIEKFDKCYIKTFKFDVVIFTIKRLSKILLTHYNSCTYNIFDGKPFQWKIIIIIYIIMKNVI